MKDTHYTLKGYYHFLKHLKKKGEEDFFWISIMDIDDFRKVNIELGLNAGNTIIEELSLRLLELEVSPNIFSGRLHKDKFVVCISNPSFEDILASATDKKEEHQ